MSFADIQQLAVLLMQLVLGVHVDEGIATRFGDPGDKWAGGPMACVGRMMEAEDMICAHLWLPCGTQVVVTNLERPGEAVCTVGDRGPYGAKDRAWQAIIDLSPAMSKAINLDGRDRVRLVYRIPPRKLANARTPSWMAEQRRKARLLKLATARNEM